MNYKNIQELKIKQYEKGLLKKWVYKSEKEADLVSDYLLKINYSINDINRQLDAKLSMKEIVFVIVLIDWIMDCTNHIYQTLQKFVQKMNLEPDYLKNETNYFKAIRSFVVAHPVNTTRHEKFGLDGNFICVDIRTKSNIVNLLKGDEVYSINLEYGFSHGINKEDDIYLMCYSNRLDAYKYCKFITFNFESVLDVARKYIEKITLLDKFMSKQRKSGL